MSRRALLLIALPAVIATAGEVREEILVVVNNHIITLRTFQQSVEQDSAALYRQYSGRELDDRLRDAREKTLQGLIDSFVIEDKAGALGIKISDEDLKNYLEDIKRQNNFSSDADFNQALMTSLGVGIKDYAKRIRVQMITQEVMRREVSSKIAIDDQELRAYYAEHKSEFRVPSRFRIRELVLPRGATPEEQQASQDKLKAIQAALVAGTPFEALVKQYSTSPSQSTGGDLGWIQKGILRPSIEEAALTLKPNQISAPLQSDQDITMVQLLEADLDAAQPFADVKEAIREKLQAPKAQNAIESYLSQLRARANIRYMVARDQILKG